MLSATLPELDAQELHCTLIRCFKAGNGLRLEFINSLRVLHSTGLYYPLGYSSVAQYAQKHFFFQKSTTYEFLRVAEALAHLPRCKSTFAEGRISWTVLRLLTQVAKEETEEEWIEFALLSSFAELKAEVVDARSKHRDLPRKDRRGLPNIQVKLIIELSLEEQNRVRTAFDKLAAEMRRGLGTSDLDLKDIFMFMVQRQLESQLKGYLSTGRKGSPYKILYRLCRECRPPPLRSGTDMMGL